MTDCAAEDASLGFFASGIRVLLHDLRNRFKERFWGCRHLTQKPVFSIGDIILLIIYLLSTNSVGIVRRCAFALSGSNSVGCTRDSIGVAPHS